MTTKNTKITTKERILHTLLFEIVALIIMASLAFIFSKENMGALTGFGLFMSIVAMIWNYFYNLGFDKIFGENRIDRTLILRLSHGLFFEAGLMLISLPILMNILNLGFIEVFLLDIGISIGFLIYAIIYNWIFDQAKEKYFSSKENIVTI